MKGYRRGKSTALRLPLAQVLPGRLSFSSEGPYPQLVIVTDLHKEPETLFVCLGPVPYHTAMLAPEELGKFMPAGKEAFPKHLWVTAQGTGTAVPLQTKDSKGPRRLHSKLLLDKLLVPLPVYSLFLKG